MQIIMLLVTFFCLGSAFQEAPNQSRLVVVVRCGGDDNLTQGVCRNVYNEFSSSPDFATTDEENDVTLIVYIPTNVNWKEREKRIRVFYIVEFLSNNEKRLSKKKGECWEDDLKTCAIQVIKHARVVARKIGFNHRTNPKQYLHEHALLSGRARQELN